MGEIHGISSRIEDWVAIKEGKVSSVLTRRYLTSIEKFVRIPISILKRLSGKVHE